MTKLRIGDIVQFLPISGYVGELLDYPSIVTNISESGKAQVTCKEYSDIQWNVHNDNHVFIIKRFTSPIKIGGEIIE